MKKVDIAPEILMVIEKAKNLHGKVSSKEVVGLFEESLLKFPDSALLLLNLHLAYYEAGIDALEAAIRVDPNIGADTRTYLKKTISSGEKDELASILDDMLKNGKI